MPLLPDISRHASPAGLFLRYFVIALLIAIALASGAFLRILTTGTNPFFYATF